MTLDAGARLGPYAIVAPLGAGGMGEVYRACDTRLDRTVAIKVLPASLAGDPQLRERFDREARAISSLNHPHICTLYDVGHQDGVDFLVLEYLEGETLESRLGRPEGPPLQLLEALTIAIDVADALATAHRAGVIHRDLKPANIFLVKSGGASTPPKAKLLDFGLAKTAAPVIATSGLSMAPTTPPNLTAQGTILGTFQYMAPEQIEGLDADARTDIFAFGAVLFEMLAGRPAFEGKTRAQLLGAILKDEPPLVSQIADARLKASRSIPPAIDRIVAICLAKDPDDRWQTVRDLLRELKWAAAQGPPEGGRHVQAEAERNRRSEQPSAGPVAWAIAAVLAIALAATSVVAVRHLRETPPQAEAVQFSVAAPENLKFGGPASGGTGSTTQLAISPDGRQLVFVAGTPSTYSLWVRPIGSLTSRQIAGTEGAAFPFWSPDSRYIGFFANGKLKKVQLAGGPPIVLCDADGRGASWSPSNVIVFSPATNGALQRVPSAGGVSTPAAALDAAYGETGHRWPYFLPDGRHFLYTGVIGACCPAAKPARIKIGALDSQDATVLIQAESASAYASGHFLFNRDGTLMAQPFDAAALRLTGDPFPIADGIASEGSRYASFSVSATGLLAYGKGAGISSAQLTWFDRAGKILGTLGDPGAFAQLVLSPDDRHVAVAMSTGSPANRDVWVMDVDRGGLSRLTFDPATEEYPVWSPDSTRVAFLSTRPGEGGIRVKLANGGANDEPLLSTQVTASTPIPYSWSSDGRFIAYFQTIDPANRMDVWILPLTGDRKPFPFAQGPGAQTFPTFSPDSRWLAYASDETGGSQVYVQPFPATGGRFQISKAGGSQPIWRADGRELFFLAPGGAIMAAAIDTAHGFQAGTPQLLVQGIGITSTNHQYAVSRDGQRFLAITPERTQNDSTMTVVTNWLATVQR